jgi:hypothetical protein
VSKKLKRQGEKDLERLRTLFIPRLKKMYFMNPFYFFFVCFFVGWIDLLLNTWEVRVHTVSFGISGYLRGRKKFKLFQRRNGFLGILRGRCDMGFCTCGYIIFLISLFYFFFLTVICVFMHDQYNATILLDISQG